MSPTPTISKPITVNFSGATTNDPVSVVNTSTGERINTDTNGNLLRVEGRSKGVIFDANNFRTAWSVGDVISVSVGGTKLATQLVTLTADTNAPQDNSTTATTASTAVLTI